ncbi:MAG: hypothetical protein FH751_14300 [Firmicutes bacterium]|nr:hypothetical protein [Bacillota bacterium]
MLKAVKIGLGIMFLGFFISIMAARFFYSGTPEYTYYTGIFFSILYLAGVVGISTSLILNELRKK